MSPYCCARSPVEEPSSAITTTRSLRASLGDADDLDALGAPEHSLGDDLLGDLLASRHRVCFMTTNSTSVGDGIAAVTRASRSGSCRVTTTATWAPWRRRHTPPRRRRASARSRSGSTAVKALRLRRRERAEPRGSCRGRAGRTATRSTPVGAVAAGRGSGPTGRRCPRRRCRSRPSSASGAEPALACSTTRPARRPPRRRRPRRRRRGRRRHRAASLRRREVRARPRIRARWAKRSSRGGSRSFIGTAPFAAAARPPPAAVGRVRRVVSSLMETLLPRSVVVRRAGHAGRRARGGCGS